MRICRLVPRGAGNQNSAASNLAILDHLQDDSGSLARLLLSNKTLRRSARLKSSGIYAESTDMGVGSDEVETSKVLAFGHGHERLDWGKSSISIALARGWTFVLVL